MVLGDKIKPGELEIWSSRQNSGKSLVADLIKQRGKLLAALKAIMEELEQECGTKYTEAEWPEIYEVIAEMEGK